MPLRFDPCVKSSFASCRTGDRKGRFPLTPQRIVHDVRQVMPEMELFARHGMYKSGSHAIIAPRSQYAAARQRVGNDGRGIGLGYHGSHPLSNKTDTGGVRCGGFMMNRKRWRPRYDWPEFGGVDHPGQRLRHDPLEAAVDDLTIGSDLRKSRLVAYAESYGAKGWRIETADGLVATLEAAFSAGGVHLVGCRRLLRK